MLIATLPSLHNRGLVEEIFSSPLIGGARYNIGTRSNYSPSDTIDKFNQYAEKYDKKLWIDLKGRQLRITKWADPTYGDIELNREIETGLPAKVYFRGDDSSYTLDDYAGNKIYIYPDPLHALGAGQALNILGTGFDIKGNYLTSKDVEYIRAARDIGVHDYMLSFVEKKSDSEEVLSFDSNARNVLKIESKRGLDFVENSYDGKGCLMAARDDLSTNLEKDELKMDMALKLIISKDRNAIVASNIFSSLKAGDWISYEDVSDIKKIKGMGYKNFMLDDTISHMHFKEAMKYWQWWGV